MQEKSKTFNSVKISELVVDGMSEIKALDITVLDLRKVNNAVADYFVICSGNSDTQIDAISESIEEVVFKATKINPWKREGKQNKEWILIDYVDVVVHIFKKDKREFFALEDLWGDGVITKVA
jgi:ribosome-associated protein